ncbi:uncharacterized protein LOC127865593 isoform X2 [Dreissena polymorpha]|uniref:uncharacterized protein LOC127865593 isoform X2 n=1 Tax=Dreissena polymorpha TaxID=45954 RepID=UPI002264C503|nr:uncharacterized protein LOC127865593 isoform X2 [Dreissena polymorpha]
MEVKLDMQVKLEKLFGVMWAFSMAVLAPVLAQFPMQTGMDCGYQMIPCANGYTINAHGCRVCATSGSGPLNGPAGPSGMNMHPGGDPLHQGGASLTIGSMTNAQTYSNSFITACVVGTVCDLHCDSGYLNGPMNSCQFCICAPSNATYKNPCSGSPTTCDLVCKEGHAKGPGDCEYCLCTNTSQSDGSTAAPAVTGQPSVSEEECIMKITNCQLLHPFGFMTDDTCDMCIDKDEIYAASFIPLERQPQVRLVNPCIQGFDICMIFCTSGYRTGPRNCQYCACNN